MENPQQELADAAMALAEAQRRYRRAEAEAERIARPEGIDDGASFERWLIETFKTGSSERTVDLSGAQVDIALQSGLASVEMVTPFGRLRIVPATD